MDEEEKLKVMGLLEHVDELRGRLIKSIVAIVLLFFICYYYSAQILNFLKIPLVEVLPAGAPSLHYTGPLDVFMANVQIGFFAAVVLACPIWLYQFWRFVEPALYKQEKRYVLPFMSASIVLFISGVAFCYYIMLPVTLKYLIGLGTDTGVTAMITIADYLSIVTLLLAGFGAVFETPVILVLLAALNLITSKMLTDNRRILIIIILIVAAIITPTPDPISMAIMAVPMYLMFEGSIFIIKYMEMKRRQHDEKSAAK